MKTLHRVLIGFVIVLAMGSNAIADYLVSGAGANEVNGHYAYFGLYQTDKSEGIYSSQDMPVYKNSTNDYYLAYRGCSTKWVILRLMSGPNPVNIGGSPQDGYIYINYNDLENPPQNGWEPRHESPAPAPTVTFYPPAISISTFTLSNGCTEGNNASSQSFEVWNSGGGTLSYSISDDATWLSCTPNSGTSTGELDTITVNYSTSALSAGTYTADITISDSEASNSPQTISVTLTVSELPVISISTYSLSPSCTFGNNASSQSFEVWNSGGETLSYSISDNAAWLSCTPTSGTSTGEHDTIAVNYSTSALSVGTHTADITISDPGASNSPQTISVTLTVGALPENPDPDGDDTSGGGGSIAGCFIATAAYGSSVEPYFKILSEFRNRFLLTKSIGKTFVDLYNTYSTPMAGF